MIENTHFKEYYTSQEIEECFQWFEQHMDRLPDSLQLSPSTYFPRLRFSVDAMMQHLRNVMKNHRIYNGEFATLLFIREKVLQQEGFQE